MEELGMEVARLWVTGQERLGCERVVVSSFLAPGFAGLCVAEPACAGRQARAATALREDGRGVFGGDKLGCGRVLWERGKSAEEEKCGEGEQRVLFCWGRSTVDRAKEAFQTEAVRA